MTVDHNEELITNAINAITENLSKLMLQEFLKLPTELQISMILIKSAQLLLANVLCHVATNIEELENIATAQGQEIKDLTLNCAYSGFPDKFAVERH